MIESLITSKTRIKLLLKFFLNSNTRSWLRDLEHEFGESTNAIRLELNRFEEAGLLKSEVHGNKKIFQANTKHPLFMDIHNILLKQTGIDHITERIIRKIGGLKQAWLLGEMAQGKNSSVIDLLFVGDNIDNSYLLQLASKAQEITGRKIRFMTTLTSESSMLLEAHPEALLLWEEE